MVAFFFFLTEFVPQLPKELSAKLQPSPNEKQTSPTSKNKTPSQIEIFFFFLSKTNNPQEQPRKEGTASNGHLADTENESWPGRTEGQSSPSPTNLCGCNHCLNHLLHIFFTLLQGKCFIDKASPSLVITPLGLSEI